MAKFIFENICRNCHLGIHLPIRHNFRTVAFNSLPNDKIMTFTKLKAIADDIFNVAKMMISVFDAVENIMGKGENAGYQHFLLFT